jgi:hypothetical protein
MTKPLLKRRIKQDKLLARIPIILNRARGVRRKAERLCFEGSAKVVEAMIFPNRYRQVTEKERDHDPKAG